MSYIHHWCSAWEQRQYKDEEFGELVIHANEWWEKFEPKTDWLKDINGFFHEYNKAADSCWKCWIMKLNWYMTMQKIIDG